MASPQSAASVTQAPALRDRLIVALDLPTVDDADRIVETLGDTVSFYKVGMQLQFAAGGAGLRYAEQLVQRGKSVFLDSKLFDIQETVERAVENVARMGVRFLTVHGTGKTIDAAVKGRSGSALQILAVTVLTSLDSEDLQDLFGVSVSVPDLVLRRAQKALDAGADGVIASGQEVELIRNLVANKLRIVTPGIRRQSDARHDQIRIATPGQAIRAGADYLVVGRPITKALDPRRAAEEILQEIWDAL
ncbi:MAG TPA: orotidine-5'-phosphate decarboxylase [Rhizomicrobium sp.]|nr:orotidine-5'-phosphate decarboxylase [Rhizomicrobium sp.]